MTEMNSSAKRKLCIFLPGLYGGGAERVLLNLAEGFSSRGLLVDIVLAQNEGAFNRQIPFKARLIPLRDSLRRSHRTLTALPALVKYLKKERPDFLLSALHGNIIAVGAKIFARVPVKLVLTEHNTYSMQNTKLPPFLQWINTILVRWLYPKADEIIAVSKGVADDLVKSVGIDQNRIKVIYNPVINDAIFVKANRKPIHPWYESSHPPVVIAIGRLTEQKDFPLLIDAFRLVVDEMDARLIILGEGEDRDKLLEKVDKLRLNEYVSMPGFVDNPYSYLSHSSLFVLSSKWEGLPTVLVEAMACGLPVISTDCPSGPYEILKEGKFGRLIPVGDAIAMASAIKDGLTGKIPRSPKEGWEEFTLKNTVDQYLSVLS